MEKMNYCVMVEVFVAFTYDGNRIHVQCSIHYSWKKNGPMTIKYHGWN